MAPPAKTQILILGGGFGGLYAALQLDRTIARDADVEITLINETNFILFTPMLHEVAASDLDMTNIVNPIRKMLKHVAFIEAIVEKIDLSSKSVTIGYALPRRHREIQYDKLLIAIGSQTRFFDGPGLRENAITINIGNCPRFSLRLAAMTDSLIERCKPLDSLRPIRCRGSQMLEQPQMPRLPG